VILIQNIFWVIDVRSLPIWHEIVTHESARLKFSSAENILREFLCVFPTVPAKLAFVKIITDERCTGYARAGHPENPRRVAATVALLKSQTELTVAWTTPEAGVSEEILLRAHSPEVLRRLNVRENFDEDTPFFENISGYAHAAVAAALDGLKFARNGETCFSLMRPPGHHATRQKSMGFCYLNNIAIAVLISTFTMATAPRTFCATNPASNFFPSTSIQLTLTPARKTPATIVSTIPSAQTHRA